jgi:hypothetical protein
LGAHRWVTGQEQEEQDASLWPSVYQGLDVYQEPSGALPALPAASLLGIPTFSQGEPLHGQQAQGHMRTLWALNPSILYAQRWNV